MTLALPARAKLNLDLEVIRRTDDGFHDLRSTMQAIDLHDLLEIDLADQTTLTTSGLATAGTRDNSVLKAHAALEQAAHRSLPARFHLHKRIPPGSGIGGASSDAAAALEGLAAMHRLDVDLLRIAASIGSDVPFFLAGGTAKAEGRGEKLTRMPTASAWFAVAWPGIELSTSAVYRAWDEVRGEPPNQLRRAAERVEPRLARFAAHLGEGWQMTGSGSAFFRRCQNDEQARHMIASLDCWTAVARAVGPWA
ncbi:MAG: 4-(cytidine 5'-diphospho)-2-C-methyl-D-erythritol kinase [Candidatus Dormibacteraceae bacterium]